MKGRSVVSGSRETCPIHPVRSPTTSVPRRQMLCSSAAGGARAGEAAQTAAALSYTLTRSRRSSTTLCSAPLSPPSISACVSPQMDFFKLCPA